jgi:predicted Zn-dependent peptidase
VDPHTFNVLKEDTIKNVQNGQSDPHVPLGEAVLKKLYGTNHPYAKDSATMIRELTQYSLEAAMSVYRQALANVDQTSLIMVSPQPVETQQNALNQAIQGSGWFSDPYRRGQAIPPTPPVFPARGTQGPILVPNEMIPRAHILQAWRAPSPNDPDYPAFRLLLEMLRGFSGGFFKVLRTEKGLVYGTQQNYNQDKQGSMYSVIAQVDFDKVGPALQGMQQVIQQVVQTPPSESELTMAKKKYLLNMRTAMQTTEGVASISEHWLQNDLYPLHPSTIQQAIERITVADIQRAANRFLNPANGFQVTGVTAPKAVLSQWFGQRSIQG